MNLRIRKLRLAPQYLVPVLAMAGLALGQLAPNPGANAADPAPAGGTNAVYPIDLPTALRLVGAQNLDLQIARQRLLEAEAAEAAATWRFFPWLSPGVSYYRHDNRIQDVVGNLLDTDKQSYAPGATLTAQVSLGDAIYGRLAAKQLRTAAGEAVETQRQDAVLAAATGFFELARARGYTDVVREAVRVSQDYENQVGQAVSIGLANKSDQLRVRVQTQRYAIDLRRALERQRVAAARLAQVLHLDPAIELSPPDAPLAPLTLTPTNVALPTLLGQALAARPELRQSRALISAAERSRQGATVGPLVPEIAARGFAGGLGGGVGSSAESVGPSEDVGVYLGWRIGPGGLFDSSRIQGARARLAAARFEETKVRDDVLRQVVESHERVRSTADQITSTWQNLETAQQSLQLSLARRDFGVAAVLEAIQAQQDLTTARAEFLNSVAEYNQAQYSLSRAVGQSPK